MIRQALVNAAIAGGVAVAFHLLAEGVRWWIIPVASAVAFVATIATYRGEGK